MSDCNALGHFTNKKGLLIYFLKYLDRTSHKIISKIRRIKIKVKLVTLSDRNILNVNGSSE